LEPFFFKRRGIIIKGQMVWIRYIRYGWETSVGSFRRRINKIVANRVG